MNFFKKVVIPFTIAIAFASQAYAAPEGEAKVKAAAEGTVAKLENIVSMVNKGAPQDEVLLEIKDARQLQKDFRYEVTERQRQKAGDQLKAGRDALQKGDVEAAKISLATSLDMYKEMLKTYNAAH